MPAWQCLDSSISLKMFGKMNLERFQLYYENHFFDKWEQTQASLFNNCNSAKTVEWKTNFIHRLVIDFEKSESNPVKDHSLNSQWI